MASSLHVLGSKSSGSYSIKLTRQFASLAWLMPDILSWKDHRALGTPARLAGLTDHRALGTPARLAGL
jgi:hypothetical protein